MSRQSRRHLGLAIATALVLSTSLAAQDQGHEFRWSGTLAPEKVVEIKNLNGTIAAGPASGDQIEVTAVKSGPDADRVKIEVVPSGEGVTFCAIYPGGLFGSSGTCEPGEHWHSNNVHGDKTKVDFTVRLPENLRFSAQNVNGSIKAEGLGRFVHATSVNGSVHVSTKNFAELSTVNGSIEGRMGRADWTGTLKISTVNGSVDLTMPGSLSADVKFRSVNGHMNSDFPLTVSGSFGGRKMDGRVGSGGRELVVETVNGSVSLHHDTI
jgi:hypothetical protein